LGALYLTSANPGAGKTGLAGALASLAKSRGKQVGFFKPFSLGKQSAAAAGEDADSRFLKDLLGLSEPPELLCPIALTTEALSAPWDQAGLDLMSPIVASYEEASAGKDGMVIEGPSTQAEQVLRFSVLLADSLNAKVILIANYTWRMDLEKLGRMAMAYGGRSIGIIINKVPALCDRLAKTEVAPDLERRGIKVLGIIPETRALLGVRVGELAAHLKGRFLTCPEGDGEIIEHFMAGAMTLDNATVYFSRWENKAVITRGDRPDLQWAALDTPTRCIVATGNQEPIAYVVEKSRENGVPIIMVEQDTLHTMSAIEALTSRSTVYYSEKVNALTALLRQHCDVDSLVRALV